MTSPCVKPRVCVLPVCVCVCCLCVCMCVLTVCVATRLWMRWTRPCSRIPVIWRWEPSCISPKGTSCERWTSWTRPSRCGPLSSLFLLLLLLFLLLSSLSPANVLCVKSGPLECCSIFIVSVFEWLWKKKMLINSLPKSLRFSLCL